MGRFNHSVDTQTGITANDVSGASECRSQTLNLAIRCTTATAGSLTATVEFSPDGVNFAAHSTPDAFAAITGTGITYLSVPARAGYFRISYAVTTGPFTFTVYSFGVTD